jgi:hypothetical protein
MIGSVMRSANHASLPADQATGGEHGVTTSLYPSQGYLLGMGVAISTADLDAMKYNGDTGDLRNDAAASPASQDSGASACPASQTATRGHRQQTAPDPGPGIQSGAGSHNRRADAVRLVFRLDDFRAWYGFGDGMAVVVIQGMMFE